MQGFTVLMAENPMAAERMLDAHTDRIHLLLSDIVMPGGRSGFELALKIQAGRKDLKTIFITGYSDEIISGYGMPEGEVHILQKPFSFADLLTKIDEVLGRV